MDYLYPAPVKLSCEPSCTYVYITCKPRTLLHLYKYMYNATHAAKFGLCNGLFCGLCGKPAGLVDRSFPETMKGDVLHCPYNYPAV